MRSFIFVAVSSLALAACNMSGQDNEQDADAVASAEQDNDYGYDTYSADNFADTMASDDEAYMQGDGSEDDSATFADPEDRPIMQAQVVLDRQGFGPGVIDGKMGMSTENALRGFQQANDLDTSGALDEQTKTALEEWARIPATRVVTVPDSWGQEVFTQIPDDPEEQADMERLGYNSLDEKLAERFHTTVDVLKQLNPDGRPAGAGTVSQTRTSNQDTSGNNRTASKDSAFTAGQQIRVPNIGADMIAPGSVDDRGWQQTLASLGVGSDQPEVDRIVVSESDGVLRAYEGDQLVALFTVTSGSKNDPLPIGEWNVTGIAKNPPFSYDPDLFWDVPDSNEDLQLPPGPNGPVGIVWIDLSKEHYGIHGTPEPQTIGRVQSHGCVRLTNWDAARLSEMVSQSTQVIFEA